MSWKRSDKLALTALVVSVVSLLASGVVSILTFKYQFSEDLSIELLPMREMFLHAYQVERSPGSAPLVRKLAAWYHVRVNNRSNGSVSVVDAQYREDAGKNENVPTPFVASVDYTPGSATVATPIRLPFQLAAGEARELFVLLPTTVTDHVGRILITLLRSDDRIIDSDVETILFAPNYFEDIQKKILKEMRSTEVSKLVDFHAVNLGRMSVGRGLLSVAQDGSVIFRDTKNDAKDGFRFSESLDLQNRLNDVVLKSKGLTFASITSAFSRYLLVFRTSRGDTSKWC